MPRFGRVAGKQKVCQKLIGDAVFGLDSREITRLPIPHAMAAPRRVVETTRVTLPRVEAADPLAVHPVKWHGQTTDTCKRAQGEYSLPRGSRKVCCDACNSLVTWA